MMNASFMLNVVLFRQLKMNDFEDWYSRANLRIKGNLLCAFFVKLTIEVIIGANPPDIFKKPFKNAAAVLIHLP